ncbi:hypothetical protein PCANC_12341 [Puccinia coronata f. sp. avenae]|uniref:Uncharacterized protein n=1 Tax=Puccinia coronata f. sp. avenae TaxID=200324 RepID=A0A2N5SGL8_9BASI|nr:hypothetical protein PCANC_23380 [Puccinia coronata f. sp. avenae]PLW44663.1 hypothetical protein PCANC_12341 [Puccinia coronata f. sp. avenae]PLW44883.1 hypothetical protein PCASD_09150 [Puccinia coronata f. sp. avenae]
MPTIIAKMAAPYGENNSKAPRHSIADKLASICKEIESFNLSPNSFPQPFYLRAPTTVHSGVASEAPNAAGIQLKTCLTASIPLFHHKRVGQLCGSSGYYHKYVLELPPNGISEKLEREFVRELLPELAGGPVIECGMAVCTEPVDGMAC